MNIFYSTYMKMNHRVNCEINENKKLQLIYSSVVQIGLSR